MSDINEFIDSADRPVSSFQSKRAEKRSTIPVGISLTSDSLDQIDAIIASMIENKKGEPNRTELMRFGLFLVNEMLANEQLSSTALKLWDQYDAEYRKKKKTSRK